MKTISKFLSVVFFVMTTTQLLLAAGLNDTSAAQEALENVTPTMIESELAAVRNAPEKADLFAIERHILVCIDNQVAGDRRRIGLELWLKAIDSLDQVIDPSYDPTDFPVWDNIAIDPRGVSKEWLQAWEASLRDLEKRNEYKTLQSSFYSMAERWMHFTVTFIRGQYTSSQRDLDEVDHLIEMRLSKKERREHLKAAFKAN
jgi:hypothetical protein